MSIATTANPTPAQAGHPLTYTIRLTNTGNVSLTTTITNHLPAHVTPTGTLVWTPTLTAPGRSWVWPVVVTVEIDYTGLLTNVVRVSTEEGASGVYTQTISSEVTGPGAKKYRVYLPVIVRE